MKITGMTARSASFSAVNCDASLVKTGWTLAIVEVYEAGRFRVIAANTDLSSPKVFSRLFSANVEHGEYLVTTACVGASDTSKRRRYRR
jgi:hypothetical protein